MGNWAIAGSIIRVAVFSKQSGAMATSRPSQQYLSRGKYRFVLLLFTISAATCGIPVQPENLPETNTIDSVEVSASVRRESTGPEIEITFHNVASDEAVLALGCLGWELYRRDPRDGGKPVWTDNAAVGCPGSISLLELSPGESKTLSTVPVTRTASTSGEGIAAGRYFIVAVVRTTQPEMIVRVLAGSDPIPLD